MTSATLISNRLRELWIHTGTACNLECPFCLEGSKPGDTRLDRITLAEVKPYLDEAVQLSVDRFIFTGGEPLIVKDIVKILSYALQLKPCLILTNGTAPLIKRAHQLAALKQNPHPLSFRISIDRPDEQHHDAERGWGNFKRAIEGLRLLHAAGFSVSIARHSDEHENSDAIDALYRELLNKHDLPSDLPIVPWPEFGRPGASSEVARPTQTEVDSSPHPLMCRDTRMLVKRDSIRTYACPLTDDDVHFDLGASLAASMQQPITLTHYRCRQCVRRSANLGE